jgi:hypothetical protein
MTSTAKRRANRINAGRSTGPRTERGKARSAQNAMRRGLAVPVAALPMLSPLTEAIARIVARPNPDSGRLDLARRFAEVQVDLRRVRAVKLGLLARLQDLFVSNQKLIHRKDIRDVLDNLIKIDRYETRAMSSRRFAERLLTQSSYRI